MKISYSPNRKPNRIGLNLELLTKQAPYVVNVATSISNDLDKDRFLDVAQIRSIRQSRRYANDGQRVLGSIEILEDNYWQQIQDALSIVCDFSLG